MFDGQVKSWDHARRVSNRTENHRSGSNGNNFQSASRSRLMLGTWTGGGTEDRDDDKRRINCCLSPTTTVTSIRLSVASALQLKPVTFGSKY